MTGAMSKQQVRPTRSRTRKLPEPREADSTARQNAPSEAPKAPPAMLDLSKVTKAAASQSGDYRNVEVRGTTSNRAFIELPSEVVPEIFFTRPKVQQKDAMVAFLTSFTFRLHPVEDGQAEPVAEVRATTELVYSMKPRQLLGWATYRRSAT